MLRFKVNYLSGGEGIRFGRLIGMDADGSYMDVFMRSSEPYTLAAACHEFVEGENWSP